MRLEALHTLINRADLPPGVILRTARPMRDGLFPEEAASVARALPSRIAEFAGGRHAARQAILALGLRAAPIPMGADRAPVWPAGVVGSITHADGLCVAAVARADRYDAIGLDLEFDAPLPADLISEICRKDELSDIAPGDHATHAKRLFSAKEALYKAQYPATRTIFGFHGLSVSLARGLAQYTDEPDLAQIPQDLRRALPIRQLLGFGLILSLCARPS